MQKIPSLGWYEVGSTIHWDKASALIDATSKNLGYSDVRWNFNDEEFGKVNWTQEPPGDVRSYYWARARQIREEYDYLILNFSGGSDSATVLRSFVDQGLLIDEVVMRHATAGTEKYRANNLDFDASNEHSELEFAAMPILKWLEKVSPRTKIVVHDFSLDVIGKDKELIYDENFVYWCGDFITPGCIVRYNHNNIESFKRFDCGQKIAIIFGTDKPRIVYQNGRFYNFFIDRTVHVALPATVTNGYDNINVELFYWSPKSILLMVKQAHEVKRWFSRPENKMLLHMLDTNWQTNPLNRTILESILKAIIYPDYDLTIFQCNKPVRSVFQEWDYWMANHTDSEAYKIYMRGLIHLKSNIDKSFLRLSGSIRPFKEHESVPMVGWEYKIYTSKWYDIGT